MGVEALSAATRIEEDVVRGEEEEGVVGMGMGIRLTRTHIALMLVGAGVLIALPSGLDDLLINLPVGLGLSKLTGASPVACIASTYLMGAAILVAGLLMLSKRLRSRVLRKKAW